MKSVPKFIETPLRTLHLGESVIFLMYFGKIITQGYHDEIRLFFVLIRNPMATFLIFLDFLGS